MTFFVATWREGRCPRATACCEVRARPQEMRLFVALELPADVRTWLAHRVRPFQETSAVRWVPETNYHLTLAFLGQIAAEQFEPIDSALKTIASGTAVVRTSITGVRIVPGRGSSRVGPVGRR